MDYCDTISVEKHLSQDCWDLSSKSNNLEADLTTLKKTGLFLVSSPIFGVFSQKIEGTASILRNLSGADISNLPYNCIS